MAAEYTTEASVFNLLEARYPSPQYAIFRQVADSTGYGQSRWADAVAFGLWPSRGLEIEGFEIKVSRSDWLSELNDHTKSSAIQKHCHRWWIVAGSRKLVKPEELPKTWGLIIPRGQDGLEIKVPAPLLKPKRISRKFCAAVMRRAHESHQAHVQSKHDEIYKKALKAANRTAVEQAKREISEELIQVKAQLQQVEAEKRSMSYRIVRYEAIEREIGVPLASMNFRALHKNIGTQNLEHGANQLQETLYSIERGVKSLSTLLERADEIAEALEALEEDQSGGESSS